MKNETWVALCISNFSLLSISTILGILFRKTSNSYVLLGFIFITACWIALTVLMGYAIAFNIRLIQKKKQDIMELDRKFFEHEQEVMRRLSNKPVISEWDGINPSISGEIHIVDNGEEIYIFDKKRDENDSKTN